MPEHTACALMFHGIGDIPAHIVADEQPYWIGWDLFEAIVADVAGRAAEDRDVIFTFDDGNASDHRAAEMLAERGLSGKFFVLAGRIGAADYLDSAQMQAMIASGMEIGLHGRDHINWREASGEMLEDELVAARAEIAAASGAPVTSVAIPFGAYNKPVMQRLERDDFAKIYTSDLGLAAPNARIVKRNTVKAEHGLADIQAMIADKVPLKARLRRSIAPAIKRRLG